MNYAKILYDKKVPIILSKEEVQRILKENTGKPGVEDLYFTSFVVQ